MKKMNSMVMAIALLTMALPMNAQTNKNKQQESLVKKVTTIWNNAKKQVKQTGKDIGEKIGFDDMAADRALHTEILLHSRGVAGSGFPPLSNIPHCCLP